MNRELATGVFLTGSNGFIGTQIARNLILETNSQITALVRGENQENAVLRLKRAWWEWPELKDQVGKRVVVLNGDLSAPNMSLSDSDYDYLVNDTSYVIHAAANTTPNLQLEELEKINVVGSANIMELAKKIQNDHGLKRLSHISTAFVAGRRDESISENDLTDKYGFSSLYEKTKYQSELLMNDARNVLPISIFRPSLVVGDSKTGAIRTFNTVYYMIKLYMTGHLRLAPASPALKINIVPVDYVADSVVKLTFDDKASGLTFHLTSPADKTPTASELFKYVRVWARDNMKLNLPNLIFAPSLGKATQSYLSLTSHQNPSAKKINDAFKTLSPYFSQNKDFKRENIDRLMGPYTLNWMDYLGNLLQYAVHYSFFHRSERTVHEQILFRLQSEAKPITYHEICDGKVITYKTKDVRDEILTVAAAMKNMGIKKGDAVAIITPNTIRYLLVDVATGLLGAVLSPLYITTPVAELKKILAENKAKILFVGSAKLLKEIAKINIDITIVSLLKEHFDSKEFDQVLSWQQFVSKSNNEKVSDMGPMGFEDLATIRYTYGSTGDSKGACLEHGGLRYLAESLASNLPWKIRNSEIRYLSFLPLNHVAEGINAAYAPYYVPAKIDLYYLEDFKFLQQALRITRPSIFFSIPRFYEKLWEALLANPVGKRYVEAKNGLVKNLLRRLVHNSLLSKSGLDECSEFIVGAACTSDILIKNFKDLGIEIQNAYGLSEAPLVTMNRLGLSKADTVGPPLLGTNIRIDEDGEVLIKGPQVMKGYLGSKKEQPFKNGWLATGDIGEITVDGHLKINGRKKTYSRHFIWQKDSS